MVLPADTEDRCNPAQFVARSVTKYVVPQRFGSSGLSQLVLSTGIGESANVWQPYGVVPTQASKLGADKSAVLSSKADQETTSPPGPM
jgi:hypothetical protein